MQTVFGMMPLSKLSRLEPVDVLSLLVFMLLALNFATPTLNFFASFSGQTPIVFSYVVQFLASLPFFIAAIFFLVLLTQFLNLENSPGSRSFVSLQALLAIGIVIMWLDRNYLRFWAQLAFPLNFIVDVLPIILVILLYATWMLTISRVGNKLNLSNRVETLYFATNLVFALSFSLHLFKTVDFFYYFAFRLPLLVSWIIDYAPTLLVSFMSLIAWASFLFDVKKLSKLIVHDLLVLLPVGFTLVAIAIRPLVGYVLTSAIVWGSSYEFFYPPSLSLALVLLATTAFISSSILIGARCTNRNARLVRLSLASAVLAGVSPSPLSILGVLLSLQFLFLGIKPRQTS